MAKTSNPRPLICATLVCDRVLQEADTTLSAIRIIDNITVGFVGPTGSTAPDTPPPMGVTFTVLVISKAGEARGERTFRVRLVRPNGKPVGDDAEFRALFQNEESGANFILRVGIQTTEMGLYWVEVYVDGEDEPLARTPFRLIYEPGVKTP